MMRWRIIEGEDFHGLQKIGKEKAYVFTEVDVNDILVFFALHDKNILTLNTDEFTEDQLNALKRL